MNCNRRDFVKLSGLSALTFFFLNSEKVLAKNNLNSMPHHLVTSEEKNVVVHNLITKEIKKYPTSIKGHDFYQHPLNPNLIYAISKWEKKSSIVDLALGREVSLIDSFENGFNFYGHIAFNADGTKFYSPQINTSKNSGTVIVYDAKTNRPIDQIGNIIGGTHDVCFLSDQKTLVIISDGLKNQYERIAPSSLLFIDVETKKQTHQFHLENSLQKLSHLRLLENDEIVILTTPLDIPREGGKEKHGYVYSNRANLNEEILYQWKMSKEAQANLDFELLSSSYNSEKHELLVTNPVGKTSLLFDTKKREIKKFKKCDDQGVVTFNNNFITVKSGGHAKLLNIIS